MYMLDTNILIFAMRHPNTPQNNHTGLAKVVLKYGLYIDIWVIRIIEPYIYVRGIGKAC